MANVMTLREFAETFKTEDDCLTFLVQRRWPNGVRCPRCNSEKVTKLSKPWRWQCRQCQKNGYRFSPLVRTIFENTNYPLMVWFQVMLLMCHSKKGMSALQIQRTLGSALAPGKGSYETFWYLCTRIRAAMKNEAFRKLLGVVEVDETFIGGKTKNRHVGKRGQGTGWQGKTPVIGAISRKGNVVCQTIENTDTDTLEGFVKRVVDPKVRLVVTDDAGGYRKLEEKGFRHEAVAHSQNEYVRGEAHTGHIESFWSLLKRGIMGSFHHVSAKYLPLYLNEFSFRYNNRHNDDMFGLLVESA